MSSHKIVQLDKSNDILVNAAIDLAVESFASDTNTPLNPPVAHCIHGLRIWSCLDVGTVWVAISAEGWVDSIACVLPSGASITQARYYRRRLDSCLGLAHISLGDKDDISEPRGWTKQSHIVLSPTRHSGKQWKDLDRLVLLATRPSRQGTHHLATQLLDICTREAKRRETGLGLFTQTASNVRVDSALSAFFDENDVDHEQVTFYKARGFKSIASLDGVEAMIFE